MIDFLKENVLSIISALFGGSSLVAYFLERKKNLALTSQEVSKSDQEKIVTADKTIDLVNKLTERMDVELEKSNATISKLEAKLDKALDELYLYQSQCSQCSNNKIGKK